MTTKQTIRDTNWLFHPGEYLEDELEARGWKTRDAANRAAESDYDRRILELTFDLTIAASYATLDHCAAKAAMGQKTADALARAFGTSAELWLNLEREYHKRLESMGAN